MRFLLKYSAIIFALAALAAAFAYALWKADFHGGSGAARTDLRVVETLREEGGGGRTSGSAAEASDSPESAAGLFADAAGLKNMDMTFLSEKSGLPLLEVGFGSVELKRSGNFMGVSLNMLFSVVFENFRATLFAAEISEEDLGRLKDAGMRQYPLFFEGFELRIVFDSQEALLSSLRAQPKFKEGGVEVVLAGDVRLGWGGRFIDLGQRALLSYDPQDKSLSIKFPANGVDEVLKLLPSNIKEKFSN